LIYCPNRFSSQADSLSDFHANTHIPVVVGGQMRYEVTGDPLYKVIQLLHRDLGREVIWGKLISSNMIILIFKKESAIFAFQPIVALLF
jgi:hypothetical protein